MSPTGGGISAKSTLLCICGILFMSSAVGMKSRQNPPSYASVACCSCLRQGRGESRQNPLLSYASVAYCSCLRQGWNLGTIANFSSDFPRGVRSLQVASTTSGAPNSRYTFVNSLQRHVLFAVTIVQRQTKVPPVHPSKWSP